MKLGEPPIPNCRVQQTPAIRLSQSLAPTNLNMIISEGSIWADHGHFEKSKVVLARINTASL